MVAVHGSMVKEFEEQGCVVAKGLLTVEEDIQPVIAECPAVGTPRVTGIAIDPDNPRSVWMSLEVDGLLRSTDDGDA